jgi:hypothetical protein
VVIRRILLGKARSPMIVRGASFETHPASCSGVQKRTPFFRSAPPLSATALQRWRPEAARLVGPGPRVCCVSAMTAAAPPRQLTAIDKV